MYGPVVGKFSFAVGYIGYDLILFCVLVTFNTTSSLLSVLMRVVVQPRYQKNRPQSYITSLGLSIPVCKMGSGYRDSP